MKVEISIGWGRWSAVLVVSLNGSADRVSNLSQPRESAGGAARRMVPTVGIKLLGENRSQRVEIMTPTPGLKATLDFLLAEDFYDTVVVGLFQNDVTITSTTVADDLVEADFTSYTAATFVPAGTPWDDPDGSAKQSAVGQHFQPSNTASPNTIFGWFLLKTGGTPILLQAERFDTPIAMNGPLDALDLAPVYRIAAG